MAIRNLLLPLTLVIILSIPAMLPLFHPGFFTMHDDQQIARLFEFDKALMAGQFPVRWVAGLGFGYGYALFNFYPPLVYYLGELFHLLGLSFVDSIKAVWLLALIGSGVSMYFFAKAFFGRAGGILAALFYVYAPYHAVDAYVRGALAELFSFVWLPLILLFAKRTVETGKLKYSLWTGIFLALLMLTHNLIFLPFFGLFTVWFIALGVIYKQKILSATSSYVLVTIVCFTLTAFFWLPSLWEKQFTLVDSLLIKNLASYTLHFVCPSQLWDSLWGFGGSIAGCVDGVSFKIGKIHIFAAFASVVVIFNMWRSKNYKLALGLLTAFCLFLGTIFMTTSYSKVIWDHVNLLWYLQFPWRFLEFVALFSAFLTGSLVLLTKNIYLKAMIVGILVIFLFFGNLKLFTPQTFLGSATDTSLTSDEEITWRVSGTSFEYMPKGVATKTTDLGTLGVAISKDQTAKVNYIVKPKNNQVVTNNFSPDRFNLSGTFNQASTLQLQITNFPGWKIWVDGKEAKISDSNRLKLLTLSLPPGNHTVVGLFTNTPVRLFGNSVALMSLFILIGLLFYDYRRHRQ